ncbi:MAG: NTP transferase domain-containing protein [Armatimonadetes bacterium]|nr:NTP transferase domain-containing protein [Armatimonadota bacterium]
MTPSLPVSPSVSAVVLAGGISKPEKALVPGMLNKALVPIHGRPMVEYVLDALREAACIEAIRVVGTLPARSAEGAAEMLPGGETFFENIRIGVKASRTQKVLLASVDVPMLTGRMVDSFIRAALSTGADFCYPIVPMAAARLKYPEMKRTSVRIREGEFTGGNLVLIDAAVLLKNGPLIEKVFSLRKSPAGLLKIIGLSLVVRFLLSRAFPAAISIPYLERRVGSILGGSASAIVFPYPEIGADIDKPEDLAAAHKIIRPAR